MTPFADIEAALDGFDPAAAEPAGRLLGLAEAVLENWAEARGEAPTADEREGFRLLGLHRQGARGEPSFNACRETCREIAYHANLLRLEPDHDETGRRAAMMAMLVRHLLLFVSGKMQVAGLGEFCCSSRGLRSLDRDAAQAPEYTPELTKVA
ncbi:MAG: hypothetical protein OXH59_08075 [Rhodospirillaceae bacterium]|nr:hypothetical protein [Rhodospirillaceae bacterium]